ncbi:general transcription factor IIH subunit TFB6 family [Aspergillus ibericus CBS 121593]|uniref:Meiotic recombination protein DMC1 n=1 Tax=Aspergillus ibericus CBS 121593 TaxID=1448316 RepID=A0A395H9K1_9EURO|nr:hypothetical protein BO80DRAFT_347916 [Aspergillus ibericus CBS 121593]RAL04350.1 hypothetical protein BO80DRAFT_347916 [Aspergillus ibericus CBS 121593]
MTSTTSNIRDSSDSGGGFLTSPAPSTTTTTAPSNSNSSNAPSLLPQPRSHPLRPGSAKEATVINYVDSTLLRIARRHAKKFSKAFADPNLPDSERGYESFEELGRDLEAVVDVLWVSGTPSLQIPYLISLAVQVNSYLAEYPFSAAATFRVLGKLDEVFAALLGEGEGEGDDGRGSVVSMTEKVRIKSIAESGRVVVVEARERERENGGDEEEDEDEDEMEDVLGIEEYPAAGKWEMQTARVYERTMQLLGDELAKVGEFCDDDMAAGENEETMCDGENLEVEVELEGEDEDET